MPIEVEDWTPCAPGKLCIGGQCIEHPDAKHYVVPKAHPGGVRLVCNSSQVCARINGKLIDRERAQRYMTCENRSCHSHTFPIHLVGNELAIRFLSCSNPYPVEMDPGCFSHIRSLASEYLPFVMYNFCAKCTYHVLDDLCITRPYKQISMFGIPCNSGLPKIKNTYCASFSACVPLYKDYPETYSIRPIQRC